MRSGARRPLEIVLPLVALAGVVTLLALARRASPARELRAPTPASAKAGAESALELAAPESAPQRASTDAPRSPESSAADAQPTAELLPAPSAGLRVRLRDVRGQPESGAHYLLTPMPAGRLAALRRHWIERTSDGAGLVEVQPLAPGPWRLRFSATNRETITFDRVLAPGWNELEDIVFSERLVAGDINVRLVSAAGRESIGGVLQLLSLDGEHDDRWNTIGTMSGLERRWGEQESEPRFTFHSLPPGRYRVSFFPSDEQLPDAPFRDTQVPGEELVFRLLDDRPQHLVRFRLRAADGGVAPAEFELCVFGEGAGETRLQRVANDAVAMRVPDSHPLRWVVLADGFLPHAGERGAFREEAGELVADIELARGRGLVVLARDADPMLAIPGVGHESRLRQERLPPLAGVEVRIDGRTRARTDRHGCALVDLGAGALELELTTPARVLADVEGWEPGRAPVAGQWIRGWLASDR